MGGGLRTQTHRLLQRQPRFFDMDRMMCFQHKRSITHFANPVFRQPRRLQKTLYPLDANESGGDSFGDCKFWFKIFTVHILVSSRSNWCTGVTTLVTACHSAISHLIKAIDFENLPPAYAGLLKWMRQKR